MDCIICCIFGVFCFEPLFRFGMHFDLALQLLFSLAFSILKNDRMTKMQPKSSRKPQKPTKSFRTKNSVSSTILTATRGSIPTSVGDQAEGAIHSQASAASREGTDRSTSPRRVRRSIPRNYSRPSSVWVATAADDVATAVREKAPTCKCMSA